MYKRITTVGYIIEFISKLKILRQINYNFFKLIPTYYIIYIDKCIIVCIMEMNNF